MKYLVVMVVAFLGGVKSSSVSPGLISVTDASSQRELIGALNCDDNQEDICTNDCSDRTDYDLQENEEDVTNSDNIVRPCGLEDTDCIRKFFQSNSQCCPKFGPVPDPLCLPQSSLYVPYANVTLTLTNVRVTGMNNTKIVEFYYNKKTRNVVLAIEIKNLNESTPKAYYSYQRTGKESIVLADYDSIEFKSITFTAVIPNRPDLRPEMAEIHAYIPESYPTTIRGPKASESSDPQVKAAYSAYLSGFPIIRRESFLLQSHLLTMVYIQKYICDFGIKLYSY